MYPRWLWPAFALPGVVWLVLLFLVPLYAVIGVAFGRVDPILLQPDAGLEPAGVERRLAERGAEPARAGRRPVDGRRAHDRVRRDLGRPAASPIGYPVAYYIARHAGRTKTLLLILLILPFWISYLMRMLAWVNLLAPRRLREPVPDLGARPERAAGWLDGQASTVILALIYGYIPLLHPAAVRRPRPDRPQPPGGGP